MSVDLATGTVSGGHAQGDTLADTNVTLAGFQGDFEGVLGSTLDDTLTGSAGDDWLAGCAGADSLTGGRGMDTLS